MALIQCSECKATVSSKADKCPSCGAPIKKPTSVLALGCGGVMLIFIIAGAISATRSPSLPSAQPPTASQTETSSDSAYYAARKFVEQNLKAPSTAKFSNLISDPKTGHTAMKAANRFKAWGWVDSQNSFGAMIRSDWAAVVQRNPATDRWTLIFLKIGDQVTGDVADFNAP